MVGTQLKNEFALEARNFIAFLMGALRGQCTHSKSWGS
jgi:hypothetical protein